MKITNCADLSWFKTYLEIENKKEKIGTGYIDIDSLIHELRPGSLYIVGGRPGTGKTTFLINLIFNLVKDKKILFLSTELSKEEVMERLYALTHDFPLRCFRGTETISLKPISFPNLNIVDATTIGLTDIDKIISVVVPNVVLFDYFQNIGLGDNNPIFNRGYGSATIYAGIVKNLVDLMRKYNVILILASQLKRFETGRENEKPRLDDLKETGKLEEAARAVLLFWRGENNLIRVNIAKSRGGRIGEITLKVNAETDKIESCIV